MKNQLEELEDSLLDRAQHDTRFGSGVDGESELDGEEFTHMRGLAMPSADDSEQEHDSDDRDAIADDAIEVPAYHDEEPEIGPAGAAEIGAESHAPVQSDALTKLQDLITDLRRDDADGESTIDTPGFDVPVVEEPERDETAFSQLARITDELATYEDEPQRDVEDVEPVEPETNIASELADADSLEESAQIGADQQPTEETEAEELCEIDDDRVEAREDLPRPRVDFSEAESLLQRLEEAERRETDHDGPAITEQDEPDDSEDLLGAVQDFPEPPPAVEPPTRPLPAKPDSEPLTRVRRPRRGQRRVRSVVRRFAIVFVLAGVVTAAGVYSWDIIQAQTASPAEAFRAAEQLVDQGKYRQASLAFQRFEDNYPGSPLKGDAAFRAGYALHLTPAASPELASRINEQAAELFEEFIAEYPSHHKTARAETLLGIVHYRGGNYREAIGILSDPERRLRDPSGYLPALRALGRAYAAAGELENARSAFLRAASLEGNVSADQDYLELAALYQQLADSTDVPSEKSQYLTRAIEQWEYASRVPGLVRSKREDIAILSDVARARIRELQEEAALGRAGAAGLHMDHGAPTVSESPGAGDTSGR